MGIEDLKARLDRQEQLTGNSGAIPLTPKGMLLDTSVEQAMDANKEKRLRWVNVGSAEKAQQRVMEGYERVPDSEGGRRVGNLALFRTAMANYDRRVQVVNKRTKDRLTAHESEVERMAEDVARVLRDKHGIKIDAERILYRENKE